MVFHALGAFDWKMKLTTMSEELRRRLIHMDKAHSTEERIHVARKFFQKLEDSGYNAKAREEIVKSATKKYWRIRLLDMIGERDMYRSHELMEEEGKFKRMRNQTWFKSKRGGVLKRILKDAGNVGEKPELNFLRKLEEQQ